MMANMAALIVITTGGTIATSATSATSTDSQGVLRPVRSGAELLDSINTNADYPIETNIEVREILSIDSSMMTPQDWLSIGAAVNQAATEADGIVITHGTDTMEETALWLDLTYSGTAPVVLTGAARPADASDADGPGNMRDALVVAAHPHTRERGVLICFSGTIFPPLGTTKIGGHTVFGGTTWDKTPALGNISGAQLTINHHKHRPYLGAVPTGHNIPRVDIVSAYPGADGTAIEAFLAQGSAGLVIEAMGAGNAGSAMITAIGHACSAGVPVIVTTRVLHGHTSAVYGPGHDLVAAGAIMRPQLRASQARVLLMAALALELNVDEVITRLLVPSRPFD